MILINKMEEYLLFIQPKWEIKDNLGNKELLVELKPIFLAEKEFGSHVVSYVSYFNSWEANGYGYLEKIDGETTIQIVTKSFVVSKECHFPNKEVDEEKLVCFE
jgi:hypothetical protein